MSSARAWIPAGSMLLVSLISYIDRNTLALLAPTILKETHLTGEQYGWIVSAFSVAYMAANPIWGRILDRVGLALGMTVAVSVWTVASAAHAFAAGFFSFAAARLILGLGEGATFPGGLRAVMQTLPPQLQGRGVAVAYSGGSLGAVLTPLLVTPVANAFGWRSAFLFTGVIGVAWLALWAVVARRPDVRKSYQHAAAPAQPPRLSDRRLWAFICAYACGGLPLAFVLYQSAIYLARVHGLDQTAIGKLLWIPPLGWEAGYFVLGWALDRLGPLRRAPLYFACLAVALPFALVPWTASLGLVMALMFGAMFAAGGSVILAVSYATEAFTAGNAGLIAGIGAGSWSAVVALLMPVFGRLFDQQRYETAFVLAGAFPVIGVLGWLALGATPRSKPSPGGRVQ